MPLILLLLFEFNAFLMYLCISAPSVTEHTKGNALLLVLITVMELLGLIDSSFCFPCLFVVVFASLESFCFILFCRLRSSLWLQFKPHHIAAGAAYLAANFLNLDLASYQNVWHEFDATPAILHGRVFIFIHIESNHDYDFHCYHHH